MKRIENKSFAILSQLDIQKPDEIDVKLVAQQFNIHVKEAKFNDDISGLFAVKNGKFYISYNKNHSEERQRFTIAHELGHFFLHKDDASLFIDKAYYRNDNSSTGEMKKEREANAFAASLLMPRAFVEREWNRHREVKDTNVFLATLAGIFAVSAIAMTYRLSNLGYDLMFD